MGKREIYVDILKGWSILTIILLHISYIYNYYTSNLLGLPWSVPIFFIIAGFFIKESSLSDSKTFIKKKIKSLYIPATTYYLLAVIVHNLFIDIDWYRLGTVHPGNGIPYFEYGINDLAIRILKVVFCAGSGELVMGAMWFIYTLLYAMVAIILLEKILFCRIKRNKNKIRFIILLALQLFSCFLTQKMGLTISRVNVGITALFLIYLGAVIHQKLKIQFNDIFTLAIAIILFVNVILFQITEVRLADNNYQDILQLCVGSISLLYIQGFIARKLQCSIIGKVLAYLGKNSLHIMALHILGYMICNSLFIKLGIFTSDSRMGMYTFDINSDMKIYFCYILFGILVPLIVIESFRYIKKHVLSWLNFAK